MIGRRSSPLIVVAALGLGACAPETRSSAGQVPIPMTEPSTTTTASDVAQAIALAEQALARTDANLADYQLVRAQRLLAGGPDCSTTRCWQLTFKLARLIPATSAGRIGAGGEVFFVVDVDKGEAKLTGYGE